MPMFDFKCEDCSFTKEHFVSGSQVKSLQCPSCGSDKYQKLLPTILINVEYGNLADINEHKINPFVKEVHEKIGREALGYDTKTLDNIYGEDKVKNTFHETDD